MQQDKVLLPSFNIGIDIGSTTMKCVVLDSVTDKEVFTAYRRHNADPLKVAREIFSDFKQEQSIKDAKLKIVITGSVGMGYAERLKVDFQQEVIAACEVIKRQYPDVHTFVDMGGEDSKMIFFYEGRVPDMRMNGNCAGGTGSFIDQTATLLGVETSELNTLAEKYENLYPIASRCGVFSKTDIQNLISRKVSKEDIAASMLNTVCMQIVSALARGMEINGKVFLCGGPFKFIPELKKHFIKVANLSKEDCILVDNAQLIPATGCALLAKDIEEVIDLQEFEKLLWLDEEVELDKANLLSPLFISQEEYDKWLKDKVINIPKSTIVEGETNKYFLGVDSGSTTTKLILINDKGEIVFSDYRFNRGDSFAAFQESLKSLCSSVSNPNDIEIAASCSTGYGENLLQTAFSLDCGIVETMAHTMAAQYISPQVSFVLDIGGQDMKAIFIENESIRRIEINEACSSGCGSFIMTFAQQLGYSISDFAHKACFAKQPYDLGTRCTVFMNSKVKQAMCEGAEVEDIAAGFSYSVIKNCLYKVLKLRSVKELGNDIVVQGGTFKNHSVVRALEKLTNVKVRFSQMPEMMGALGAALYAKKYFQNKQ